MMVLPRGAVITGGTRGLGLSLTQRFAADDWAVVACYREDHAAAGDALACLRTEGVDHVYAVCADVSTLAGARKLHDYAVRKLPSVDLLVNNAGRNLDAPLSEMSDDDWNTVVGANMTAPFLCTREFVSRLAGGEGGVVINVGATTPLRGRRDGVNYCASKAGVLAMTRCLARELAPKIRVNTLVPGLFQTDEAARRLVLDDDTIRDRELSAIPLGRFGTPEEFADAAAFLASSAARYITGQMLIVDGGQHMV